MPSYIFMGCQVIFSCESTIGTKIYPFKNVFGHHKHIAVIWNGPFKNCMLFDVNGEWIISMKFNCLPNEVEKCLFFKLGLLSILNYRDIVSLSIKAFYILFLWLAKFFQIFQNKFTIPKTRLIKFVLISMICFNQTDFILKRLSSKNIVKGLKLE